MLYRCPSSTPGCRPRSSSHPSRWVCLRTWVVRQECAPCSVEWCPKLAVDSSTDRRADTWHYHCHRPVTRASLVPRHQIGQPAAEGTAVWIAPRRRLRTPRRRLVLLVDESVVWRSRVPPSAVAVDVDDARCTPVRRRRHTEMCWILWRQSWTWWEGCVQRGRHAQVSC